MNRIFIPILITLLSLLVLPGAHAGNDVWVQKAANAAAELAQGNPQGAVNQVLPSQVELPSQTRVGYRNRQVQVSQPIPGTSSVPLIGGRAAGQVSVQAERASGRPALSPQASGTWHRGSFQHQTTYRPSFGSQKNQGS